MFPALDLVSFICKPRKMSCHPQEVEEMLQAWYVACLPWSRLPGCPSVRGAPALPSVKGRRCLSSCCMQRSFLLETVASPPGGSRTAPPAPAFSRGCLTPAWFLVCLGAAVSGHRRSPVCASGSPSVRSKWSNLLQRLWGPRGVSREESVGWPGGIRQKAHCCHTGKQLSSLVSPHPLQLLPSRPLTLSM